MIKQGYRTIGSRDLTGGISDALNNTFKMFNDIENQKLDKLRLEKQDLRQAQVDQQNKQLFDLKMQEFDRANKDREALTQFGKGMLQPQVISGIITDTIAPEQVDRMSFTPEELAQYNAAGGDLSKLTGSARTKAELQNKLSSFADTLPSSPEFQESNYQQAQRVASSMELTPGILEELKKYQVADVLAQKENKKEGTTYLGEAKELEAQIAQLKTKQGAIQDKADGIGKEWGKNGSSSGSGGKKLDTDKMLKYADMVKDTDSAEELQKMIQTTFLDPELTNSQKEEIAANIVISSGAKLPQGLLDFRKLNVSVEDAQKTVNAYADILKQKGGVSSEVSNDRKPKEIDGLADEIALLEARRNSALAKANSYSDGDRTSSARSLMSSRLDALLGGNNTPATSPSSFKEGVLKTETSNMDYSNHRKNAKGETETLGAYQFVPSTLESLKSKTGEKFTKEEFLANPALQDKYFDLLTKSNSEQLKSENLPVNDFNLWLMHNLGGGGQTKNFLSDEPLDEKTKNAMRLNLPKGVEPTRKNYILQYGNTFAGAPEIKDTPESKDVDVKALFAKVEESRNSKGKDAQGVIDYYSKKREDIANIKTNAWDRTVNAFKGGPTVDDGYGKLTGKSYSKDISNVSDSLRKDGFNSVEDIAILATNMPEGKDKEAVANVLHYKLMQSDPEYRQLMKEQEINDATWLAAETVLSAVPVGKVIGNVAKRVVGPGTHTTALPNGWAGTTGREAMEKAATQAAAEKAATKAAMQKKIAALEHDLQQLGGELSKNKVGSGMTRSGLENDFARIRKAQKELQDKLKSL